MHKLKWMAAGFLMLHSCNLINPDEPIPAYIKGNEITLSVNPLQGSSSHKIIDLYVFVDNQAAGCHPAQSTFPLLYQGSHEFVFSAGISINGIAASRGIYPFYKSYQTSLTLTPGRITEINPVFEYTDNTVFKWTENFDNPGSGIGFISTTSAGADMLFLPSGSPDIFEGNNSGTIQLNSSFPSFDVESSLSFTLPKINKAIFLELNYKCTDKLEIGLTANYALSGTQRWYAVTINPKSTWNKLYVNLTPGPAEHQDAVDFKLYLKGNLSEGNSSASYFLDNLKVIHN
jgi:hypothetical protein